VFAETRTISRGLWNRSTISTFGRVFGILLRINTNFNLPLSKNLAKNSIFSGKCQKAHGLLL